MAATLAVRAARRAGRLRARSFTVGALEDPFEALHDRGLTDGLPVVPPTPERVVAMLAGTSRDPQDVVGVVPPYDGEATVEKVAINAVMAGAPPEHLPVVLAAVEAACQERVRAARARRHDLPRRPDHRRQRASRRRDRDEQRRQRASARATAPT